MKLPRNQLAFACLIVVIFILAQADGSPSPGRRSGGSRSRSSWGSSSNSNSRSRSNTGGGGYKKKKGMSTLKKAAIVGAVAYGSYQLGKATGRFGSYHHGGRWGYNDYDRWRQQDGMLCRNNKDCIWMDPNMFCTDYEFDFSINRGWFGGDYLSVRGECECPRSMHWDNWEIQCRNNMFGVLGGAGVLVFIIFMSCCCCGGCAAFYWFKRR